MKLTPVRVFSCKHPLIGDNLLRPETETDYTEVKFIAVSNAEKNLSETQQVTWMLLACGHRRISGRHFSPLGWRERRPEIRLCLQARMLLKRGIRYKERTRKWENEKWEQFLSPRPISNFITHSLCCFPFSFLFPHARSANPVPPSLF